MKGKIVNLHATTDNQETSLIMKPTKSRVMCPDCGRQKMLFESEKQAETFLKFNEDAVNPDGTREMRVYYCPACCGYHISSHAYKGSGRATDRLIDRYRQNMKRGSLQESIQLFEIMVAQNFTSKKEVKRWLDTQENYSETTKSWALTRFYQEYRRKGYMVPGSNRFVIPESEKK